MSGRNDLRKRKLVLWSPGHGGPHGTRPVQPTKVPHAAGRCARGVQL